MSECLRVRRGRFAIALLVLACLGCGQGAQAGPGEIHWDRQTCEHCQMVISQRRHAVQLRAAGERKTHAFDDLGCALLWLDAAGSTSESLPDVEIWVRDASREDWVEARSTSFEGGQSTPMGYGFSAASGGLSIAAVQARVRETERARRTRAFSRKTSARANAGEGDSLE